MFNNYICLSSQLGEWESNYFSVYSSFFIIQKTYLFIHTSSTKECIFTISICFSHGKQHHSSWLKGNTKVMCYFDSSYISLDSKMSKLCLFSIFLNWYMNERILLLLYYIYLLTRGLICTCLISSNLFCRANTKLTKTTYPLFIFKRPPPHLLN